MYPVPENEVQRLAALRRLEILDTPPEQIYDDVVLLAAKICDMPIAIINFVDAERQWGKALVGLDSSEARREASFCARTIVQEDGLLIVPDTTSDPLWASNPQVVGEPGLRAYAGVALRGDDGLALGSLCVADNRRPRVLDDDALEALRALARQVMAHLQLREQSARLARANQDLQQMATRDFLTNLANRAFLVDSLALALRQRRRSGGLLGVMFCDLDGFKAINDQYGHRCGDAVLQAVAKRLTETARGSDLVARIAGDEFVVICAELSDPADLGLIASRVQAAVAGELQVGRTSLEPRISVGCALARDSDDVERLLNRADRAMYADKRTPTETR